MMKIKDFFGVARHFLVLIFFILVGCLNPTKRLLSLASKHEAQEDYFKAVELYELALQKIDLDQQEDLLPSFLLGSERLFELYTYQLSNPKAGLYWLEKRRSLLTDSPQIIQNQKKMIRLYMDFLNDYKAVVVESQGLLAYDLSLQDQCHIRLDLGLALFQLHKQAEAEEEIGSCLGNIAISKALSFKLASLEIDILIAKKQYQIAIDRIEFLKDTFKDLDVEQSLQLTLALAYEEMEDYVLSGNILKTLLNDSNYSDKSYIQLRLDRLLQKELQQAGARLKRKKQ
jgi:hypothetical protein